MFLIVTPPAYSNQLHQTDKAPSEHAVWQSCNSNTGTQAVSFVHVSDMHAHYDDPEKGGNPAARLRGYLEEARGQNPYTLFTNAGDDYEKGSVAEELSRGGSTRDVVHALRYDVRTLGNHDFAWGLGELLRFSRDPSGVVLSSNTTLQAESGETSPDSAPGWTDFTVLRVGCVRVGFFGLLSKPWDESDRQYEGPFYPDRPALRTDFRHADITRNIVARHRAEVDILVLVSHLGIDDDIKLARETEGIDLILGGHSHSATEAPLRVKDTLIVHPGADMKTFGHLDLEYDLAARRIKPARFTLVENREGAIPEDGATAAAVERILARYRQEMREVLAEARFDLGRREMAAIAARAAVESLGADAAFVNTGTVWRDVRRGGLTRQDLLDAFAVEREPAGSPGFSSFYLVRVTGADLMAASEKLSGFAAWGPDRMDPAGVYTVALQKPQALRQQEYFGRLLGVSPPEPAAELWETVAAFAKDRSSRGLALDESAPGRSYDNLLALLRPDGTLGP